MKLQQIQEATYYRRHKFTHLVDEYFMEVDDEDGEFEFLWIPGRNVWPYVKWTGDQYEGIDEQVELIGQDPKNEKYVWVEWEEADDDTGRGARPNGAWTTKDDAADHIYVLDERGFKIWP
jgi:hypothetical protein